MQGLEEFLSEDDIQQLSVIEEKISEVSSQVHFDKVENIDPIDTISPVFDKDTPPHYQSMEVEIVCSINVRIKGP